ncbi:MAG: type II toxin-antitoxin system PemK/MazF family toxin [Pedosphaera sp.]|nr:type II toxin-antitoxin system PemK/MazF family toxin [Pedosphaera sp.]
MAQILRGDIYWADLAPTKGHEQSGQRPVLILSNDIFNQRSSCQKLLNAKAQGVNRKRHPGFFFRARQRFLIRGH